MDAQKYIRELEKNYRAVWKDYCRSSNKGTFNSTFRFWGGFEQLKTTYKKLQKFTKIIRRWRPLLKNFYVDRSRSASYTSTSSLKSWGMRLATRDRCCRKTPSALKLNAGNSTFKETCICTRTLAGNSSLWSVTANASSYGKSRRVEAGMGHKSLQLFISSQ